MEFNDHEKTVQSMSEEQEKLKYINNIENIEDSVMLLKYLNDKSKLSFYESKFTEINGFLSDKYIKDDVKMEYARQMKQIKSRDQFYVYVSTMSLVDYKNNLEFMKMLESFAIPIHARRILMNAKNIEQKKEIVMTMRSSHLIGLALGRFMQEEEGIEILKTGCFDDENIFRNMISNMKKVECKWQVIDFMKSSDTISYWISNLVQEEIKLKGELSEETKEKFYYHLNRIEDSDVIVSLINISPSIFVIKALKNDEIKFEVISKIIEKQEKIDLDVLKDSIDDVEYLIFENYVKITNKEVAKSALKYIKENKIREKDKIENVYSLVDRTINSNSEELVKCYDLVLNEVFKTDNPEKKLEKIEQIFLRNDIPYVGKLFEVFKFFHQNKESYRNQSPVLNVYMNRKDGIFKRNVEAMDIILFNDLLKCSFGSNNRDLKKFLDDIEKGDKLLTYIKEKNISPNELGNKNRIILKSYFDKVEKVLGRYDYFIKSEQSDNNDEVDLEKRLENIMSKLKVDGKDYNKIPDMIIQKFCGFTVIKDFKTAKEYISRIKKNTDLENREKSKYPFTLEKGDFVKGLNISGFQTLKYLEPILQNGNVCKEFLGQDAHSDFTPLDADVSRVYTDDKKRTIGECIDALSAIDYGDIWCVLKNNPDKIEVTSAYKFPKANFSKLEAFHTGAIKYDQYGIRTGFASSDISYFVADKFINEIGFEIARNGFYIPVVNRSGELVFTPDDYDKLRDKMAGLKYYDAGLYKFSDNLINDDVEAILETMEDTEEIKEKRELILKHVKEAMDELGLEVREKISEDVTNGYVEFIDTGSTGRGTNKPNDGDFDFMMKLDNDILLDKKRLDEFKKKLEDKLVKGDEKIEKTYTDQGDFRFKKVNVGKNTYGEDVVVDIDITFVKKTNKISYSTDMCIKDRLETIYKQDEKKYKYVIANILLAKEYLKKAGVYKAYKSDNEQGGLGGVGVENWILQNGGSFIDAVNEFLEAAKGKTFEQFKQTYQIWDFGENPMSQKKDVYAHDNFVVNDMSEDGYKKMCDVLLEYKMKCVENKSKNKLK